MSRHGSAARRVAHSGAPRWATPSWISVEGAGDWIWGASASFNPGFFRSLLGGEAPVTYTKGQSWYESPKKPHLVSKNGSKTEPAKLLVFLLSQESEPLVVPMKSPGSGK